MRKGQSAFILSEHACIFHPVQAQLEIFLSLQCELEVQQFNVEFFRGDGGFVAFSAFSGLIFLLQVTMWHLLL